MKKAPTISIVTPSYNQGRFIAETIESVLSQEGDFYIEYLVMDGGSTDNSVEVIKNYDRLLKDGKWPVKCMGITYSWVSEKDKGQSDAINKGFRQAKGDYVAWLNSDDTYLPGALGKAAEFFSKNPEFFLVYGEGYYIDGAGRLLRRYHTERFNFERLAELCYLCQPSVFIRKEVIEQIGLLDTSLNFCMDYDYWIRIAKKVKIGYLPEYLSNARLYQETKTMSMADRSFAEAIAVVKKHFGHVPLPLLDGYLHTHFHRLSSSRNIFGKILFAIFRKPYLFYKRLEVNKLKRV